MFVRLLHLLGVTPNDGKTGKREASWALVFIAIAMTVGAMIHGEGMVSAMSDILTLTWLAAIAAVGGAYKLEHDKGAWNKMGEK
ncbi:hypothetical protein [Hoeflea poritis]|uniref:Uncharacterized protein n=1 Tax=Hoeflea poritis TaxID=2993659 RepID=A0ABT4VMN2_9HYPH|nr:hypothetical protein [Hoeflea poritis]MDA4845974.1 hypothetical protein [Hoeflea poritis]